MRTSDNMRASARNTFVGNIFAAGADFSHADHRALQKALEGQEASLTVAVAAGLFSAQDAPRIAADAAAQLMGALINAGVKLDRANPQAVGDAVWGYAGTCAAATTLDLLHVSAGFLDKL